AVHSVAHVRQLSIYRERHSSSAGNERTRENSMAKKSTATRQAHAARRPQTTAKQASVALVRTPRPDSSTTSTSSSTSSAKPAARTTAPRTTAPRTPAVEHPKSNAKSGGSAPTTRPRPPELTTAAAKPATKPSPQPAAQPGARSTASAARQQQMAKAQAARVARARATQRARTATTIAPEHYSYVIKDLKLIGALATAMFTVI